MPRYEDFSCLSKESFNLSHTRQGLPRSTQGNTKTHKGRSWLLERRHPHPGSSGSCSSPTSRPCTSPLSWVQAFPLLRREFYDHILQCQPWLKWKTHFAMGNGDGSYPHTEWEEERCKIDSVEVSVLKDLHMILLSQLCVHNVGLLHFPLIAIANS